MIGPQYDNSGRAYGSLWEVFGTISRSDSEPHCVANSFAIATGNSRSFSPWTTSRGNGQVANAAPVFHIGGAREEKGFGIPTLLAAF